uniref:P2X purinoceptor n=2 Tax=Cyprinus carpio TaxID=7962 RepID=A0A8C1LB27_CYPCA
MQQCSGKMWNCITDFFTYETTKSVVVKSWTIGIINRVVQLLIITYFIGWVFLYEKAYQVRDTAIESSVMTKVKGFGEYNNRIMDVADYVTPTQGASVFCIITKLITTENQVQGQCPESELKFKCESDGTCKKLMSKPSSNGLLTGRCVNFNATYKTCEIKGWCPAEIDEIQPNPMMEVENFTIFIKNSIRFPRFNFTKGNFLPNINSSYIKQCKFDFESNMYCPIFKVGDVIRFAQQDFTTLAKKGGVIGIKIAWLCDLDKADDECKPAYSFTRLDAMSEKTTVSPGYNFRFWKALMILHKQPHILHSYDLIPDSGPHTTLLKIKLLHDGTVLCDIILLNFLKGADQYKAKKFEEVSDSHVQSSNSLYRSRDHSEHSIKTDEKFSNDSGAFSFERYS